MSVVIILKKDVQHLGSLGDIVKVKDGYARNYLIPYGFAVEASRKNRKEIEHEKRILEKKIRTLEEKALQDKNRLEKIGLEFTRKASSKGKLFGSVTNRDIELALKEKGVEVDRRNISPANLKDVGDLAVSIKLFREIRAFLNVKIIAELVEEEENSSEEITEENTEVNDNTAENQE